GVVALANDGRLAAVACDGQRVQLHDVVRGCACGAPLATLHKAPLARLALAVRQAPHATRRAGGVGAWRCPAVCDAERVIRAARLAADARVRGETSWRVFRELQRPRDAATATAANKKTLAGNGPVWHLELNASGDLLAAACGQLV